MTIRCKRTQTGFPRLRPFSQYPMLFNALRYGDTRLTGGLPVW